MTKCFFIIKKDWCDREEEGKEESFFEIVYLTNPLGLCSDLDSGGNKEELCGQAVFGEN